MKPPDLNVEGCTACAAVWGTEVERRTAAEDQVVLLRSLAEQALALLQRGGGEASQRAVEKLQEALRR